MNPGILHLSRNLGGYWRLKIIVNSNALKETDERLFPVSKNRSRRIHKKLVRRFGGEFRKVPAMFQIGDTLITHPALYEEIKRELAA